MEAAPFSRYHHAEEAKPERERRQPHPNPPPGRTPIPHGFPIPADHLEAQKHLARRLPTAADKHDPIDRVENDPQSAEESREDDKVPEVSRPAADREVHHSGPTCQQEPEAPEYELVQLEGHPTPEHACGGQAGGLAHWPPP